MNNVYNKMRYSNALSNNTFGGNEDLLNVRFKSKLDVDDVTLQFVYL